jgi:predicted 3-demethylubiquinone-9 3-methyltransferase (glyoxalase superfamily)
MKTLTFITRTLSIAIVVVLMSTTLEAQKAYHKVTFENGITEINNMANRLIDKCKVKFDLKSSVSVSELESDNEASAENELNGMIDQLGENSRFDVNNTILVSEATPEFAELNQVTDNMMANLKFDVSQTISVANEMSDTSEIDQLVNDQMNDLKFDVNQTISVTEASEENAELDQLTNELLASNAQFDLSKTNSIQAEQNEIAF